MTIDMTPDITTVVTTGTGQLATKTRKKHLLKSSRQLCVNFHLAKPPKKCNLT